MTILHLGKFDKTVVFFQHPNQQDTLWIMRRPKPIVGYEIESGWMPTFEVAEQVKSYCQQGYRYIELEVPYGLLSVIQRRQVEASHFPIFPHLSSSVSLSRH